MPGQPEFKINQKFAEKYDKYRQKEELQKRELSQATANISVACANIICLV